MADISLEHFKQFAFNWRQEFQQRHYHQDDIDEEPTQQPRSKKFTISEFLESGCRHEPDRYFYRTQPVAKYLNLADFAALTASVPIPKSTSASVPPAPTDSAPSMLPPDSAPVALPSASTVPDPMPAPTVLIDIRSNAERTGRAPGRNLARAAGDRETLPAGPMTPEELYAELSRPVGGIPHPNMEITDN